MYVSQHPCALPPATTSASVPCPLRATIHRDARADNIVTRASHDLNEEYRNSSRVQPSLPIVLPTRNRTSQHQVVRSQATLPSARFRSPRSGRACGTAGVRGLYHQRPGRCLWSRHDPERQRRNLHPALHRTITPKTYAPQVDATTGDRIPRHLGGCGFSTPAPLRRPLDPRPDRRSGGPPGDPHWYHHSFAISPVAPRQDDHLGARLDRPAPAASDLAVAFSRGVSRKRGRKEH
jgi:hypothetical protein